jgi:hypothetical protein
VRAGYVFLASFAAMPLAGWPLLAHPAYGGLSRICRISLSAAVGAVLASFWMTVFALAGLLWRIPLLVLAAAATASLLRLLLEPESAGERPPDTPKANAAEILPTLLAALAVVWALLASASGAATSTDLVAFWGPKAQAFASARTIDSKFLSEPLLFYLHADYPPLITNLFAFGAMAAGRFPWGAAALTYPMLLAALALALPGVLSLAAPRPTARACSALIVAALGLLGSVFYVAGNGDPALWLFETLAAALLIGPAARTRSGQLLAGLFLAGAAGAKVEGLPFAAAIAALFLLVRRREIRIGSASLFLSAPTALSVGLWFTFGIARHLFVGYRGYGRFAEIHWDRLGIVLPAIGDALWSAAFALPFLLPLIALIVFRKSRLAIVPAGVCLLLSLFFVFTYLHGDPDPRLWISWSAGRIFAPVAALLAVAGVARREQGMSPAEGTKGLR